MDEVSEFVISLERGQFAYFPKQSVVGWVSFQLAVPMVVQRLTIKLTGKAFCKWKETKGVGKNNRQLVINIGKVGKEKSFIFILLHFVLPCYCRAINEILLYCPLYNSTASIKVNFIARCD